jgi:hypothetical protein
VGDLGGGTGKDLKGDGQLGEEFGPSGGGGRQNEGRQIHKVSLRLVVQSVCKKYLTTKNPKKRPGILADNRTKLG